MYIILHVLPFCIVVQCVTAIKLIIISDPRW